MHGTRSFTLDQVREILQLEQGLRSAADPLARKQLLLNGMCRFIRGDSASCEVGIIDQASRQSTVLSVVRVGNEEATSQWLNQSSHPDEPVDANDEKPLRPRSISKLAVNRPTARVRSSRRVSGGIVSTIYFVGVGLSARIRVWCDRPRFTQAERAIVDLVHLEMSWVYEDDLLLVSRNEISLSPRQRQTLDHLLAGDSEKQIAAKLQLSHNTVHHYVKALHRHFNVSSRSELLAKWVKR